AELMTVRIKNTLKTHIYPILALIALEGCNIKAADTAKNQDYLSLPGSESAKHRVKDYSGNIEGVLSVEIRPQIEGLLEEIYVDEGAFVEKGQALFKINESEYREALKNAVVEQAIEKAK